MRSTYHEFASKATVGQRLSKSHTSWARKSFLLKTKCEFSTPTQHLSIPHIQSTSWFRPISSRPEQTRVFIFAKHDLRRKVKFSSSNQTHHHHCWAIHEETLVFLVCLFIDGKKMGSTDGKIRISLSCGCRMGLTERAISREKLVIALLIASKHERQIVITWSCFCCLRDYSATNPPFDAEASLFTVRLKPPRRWLTKLIALKLCECSTNWE